MESGGQSLFALRSGFAFGAWIDHASHTPRCRRPVPVRRFRPCLGPGLDCPHSHSPIRPSALGPRSVIRIAPPRAGGICTRRWRSRRACGRRRRRQPCAASPPSAADRRTASSPCCGSRRRARLDAKPAGATGGPPPIIRFPRICPLSLATVASPARAAACSPEIRPSSGISATGIAQATGPIPGTDCRRAAVARTRGMALATRNVRDFRSIGLVLVNPWAGA